MDFENNGIDELYEVKELKRDKSKAKRYIKDYKLIVRQIKYNRFGLHKQYATKGYTTLILNNVVLTIANKIYDEVFNSYSSDELIAYYGTTDLITLLNNNDESDIIKGKIKVDTSSAEENFRKILFNKAYKTLKVKNHHFKSLKNKENYFLNIKF
ncbi:hypothetical protein [Sulfurimonas sp.]|uniref:hypothetical protein n=1 Tax=Sulfurimonas sp. TaxID=2022749 RepID=UPI002B4AA47C|nr:hypothetical protein [Sulfurimonas sp.]